MTYLNIPYCRSVYALTAIFVFSGLVSCSGHDDKDKNHDEHSAEEIVLSPHSAERFGVEVARVGDGEAQSVVPAWGVLEALPGTGRQILSSRSSGIVKLSPAAVVGASLRPGESIASVSGKGMAGGDPNAIAAEELAAAKKELARIEPLRKDGIVSERDYQAALANVRKLSAAYSGHATGSSVIAPQKATVTKILVTDGQWVDAGAPIVETATDSRLLLKVDFPLSMRKAVDRIADANFVTPDNPEQVRSVSELGGSFLSDMKSPSASVGAYMPVYFSLSNDGSLVAGSYADVWVKLRNDSIAKVCVIPFRAVVETEGEYFAYVKIGDHGYEKRRLTLGVTDGKNVEVVSGLMPEDSVVFNGAMILKMAENSGKIPEGHSHNH